MIITNINIYNPMNENWERNSTITVKDGIIDSIGGMELSQNKEQRVLDGRGMTLLPGLINLHVHLCMDGSTNPQRKMEQDGPELTLLRMANHAKTTLLSGITTVRDLGAPGISIFVLKQAIDDGTVPGPRIIAAGEVITRTGGHGDFMGMECDGVWGVAKGVRLQAKRGAGVIKIMCTGGVMTKGSDSMRLNFTFEELKAGIEAAHSCGLKTATHAGAAEGIRDAVKGGIDTVEHGTCMTEELVSEMIDHNAVWVPTLSPSHFSRLCQNKELVPRHILEKGEKLREARQNSLKFIDSGVKLGVGSDAGSVYTPHDDIVTEMELLHNQGISLAQVLCMATYGNAEILGLEKEIGTIEAGACADLILVDGNPLNDLDCLRKPEVVISRGSIVKGPPGEVRLQ